MVANRVCTTDSSSTSLSRMTVSASVGRPGCPAVATIAVVGTPLPRSPVSTSRTSVVVPERVMTRTRVVPAVQPVLAGGEGVGLALPGPLAQRGVGLGHVEGGAAADDGQTGPGGGQRRVHLADPGDDSRPVVGLGGDLRLQRTVRVERHGNSLRVEITYD